MRHGRCQDHIIETYVNILRSKTQNSGSSRKVTSRGTEASELPITNPRPTSPGRAPRSTHGADTEAGQTWGASQPPRGPQPSRELLGKGRDHGATDNPQPLVPAPQGPPGTSPPPPPPQAPRGAQHHPSVPPQSPAHPLGGGSEAGSLLGGGLHPTSPPPHGGKGLVGCFPRFGARRCCQHWLLPPGRKRRAGAGEEGLVGREQQENASTLRAFPTRPPLPGSLLMAFLVSPR